MTLVCDNGKRKQVLYFKIQGMNFTDKIQSNNLVLV